MFAIVKSGGKQHRVEAGSVLRVEKLNAEPGATVELPVVLMGGESIALSGKVQAQVLRHVKGDKVYIDKYKSGIQYRRRNGHRQAYTELKVSSL
ncbi:MAG: 50S ribosomal protein L21 [Deinococcales bacterium]